MTRRRSALLAIAAVIYVVAAWAVKPGFYDGVQPSQPYNFVCPPVAPGADTGVKPRPGHLTIKVINGISDANSAYTGDAQVLVGFLPGAFDAAGKSSVTIDIIPVSPCPKPDGLHFATNTYLISASSTLVKGASLVMLYSNLELDPSYVYYAGDPQWALDEHRIFATGPVLDDSARQPRQGTGLFRRRLTRPMPSRRTHQPPTSFFRWWLRR